MENRGETHSTVDERRRKWEEGIIHHLAPILGLEYDPFVNNWVCNLTRPRVNTSAPLSPRSRPCLGHINLPLPIDRRRGALLSVYLQRRNIPAHTRRVMVSGSPPRHHHHHHHSTLESTGCQDQSKVIFERGERKRRESQEAQVNERVIVFLWQSKVIADPRVIPEYFPIRDLFRVKALQFTHHHQQSFRRRHES